MFWGGVDRYAPGGGKEGKGKNNVSCVSLRFNFTRSHFTLLKQERASVLRGERDGHKRGGEGRERKGLKC